MTPFNEVEFSGINETLGLIVTMLMVGGLVLTVLGLVYAVRTWMAQSAAFKTRRDVADIKRMLETMQATPRPATTPTGQDTIKDGPVIARDVDR